MTETATATRTVYPVAGNPDTWVSIVGDEVVMRLADVDRLVTISPGGVVGVRTLANAAVAYTRAWHVDADEIAYYGGDAEYARACSLNTLLGRCPDGCCGVGADVRAPTLDPDEDDPEDGVEWTERARAIHHVARCVLTVRYG